MGRGKCKAKRQAACCVCSRRAPPVCEQQEAELQTIPSSSTATRHPSTSSRPSSTSTRTPRLAVGRARVRLREKGGCGQGRNIAPRVYPQCNQTAPPHKTWSEGLNENERRRKRRRRMTEKELGRACSTLASAFVCPCPSLVMPQRALISLSRPPLTHTTTPPGAAT